MKRFISFLFCCMMAVAFCSAQALVPNKLSNSHELDVYITNEDITVYNTDLDNVFLKLDTSTGEIWQINYGPSKDNGLMSLIFKGQYSRSEKQLEKARKQAMKYIDEPGAETIEVEDLKPGTFVLLKTVYEKTYILFNRKNGELLIVRLNISPDVTNVMEFKEYNFGTKGRDIN